VEADTPNERATNEGRVAPRPQDLRAIRATRLSHVAFLGLPTICMLVIGFTVRAQDPPSQQQAANGREVSRFLGDYSNLAPDPKDGDLLLYEKGDRSDLKRYNKFIPDPITIYLLPEAQSSGFDPDDMERQAKYFHADVTGELMKGGAYEIVTTAGPGVLELNVAITNVEPTGGNKNAAVKAATTDASVATVPGISLAVLRLSFGKVSIEGEMVDSTSGDRLVAFVPSKGGRRWFSGFNAYKKSGDIEAAFRSWVMDFRKRLDQAHGA
jgi:hypothetical protein